VPREWSGTRAKETVSGNSGPIGSILADLGDVCWSSNSGGRADVAGYLKRAIAPDAQSGKEYLIEGSLLGSVAAFSAELPLVRQQVEARGVPRGSLVLRR
jgi:hypothetical protein